MIRAVVIALIMLFAFGVAWLIALPTLDIIISAVKPHVKGTMAETVINNVEVLVGNTLVWVGVAVFIIVAIWLIVYAFRREVDTYAEYPQ